MSKQHNDIFDVITKKMQSKTRRNEVVYLYRVPVVSVVSTDSRLIHNDPPLTICSCTFHNIYSWLFMVFLWIENVCKTI